MNPKQAEQLTDALKAGFAGLDIDAGGDCPVLTLASPDQLVEIMTTLRDQPEFDFKLMVDLTAVHYPDREGPPLELVLHLLSVYKNQRMRVKLPLAENQPVPTLTGVWSNADWYERECYEMFGILFAGHPDLRRLLTEYDFEGYPLRKEFPLSGHFQVRYDTKQERVIREPVKLSIPNRVYYQERP